MKQTEDAQFCDGTSPQVSSKTAYEAPTISELGSLLEMTRGETGPGGDDTVTSGL